MESKHEFEIQTIAYGTIKFAAYTFWRELLLFDQIKNYPKISDEELVSSIAKVCLYQINDHIYDYDNQNDLITFIKNPLNLTTTELNSFSELFLEKNKYLLGKESTFMIGIGNMPPMPIKIEKKKEYKDIKWEKVPIKKLRQAWDLNYKMNKEPLFNIIEKNHFNLDKIKSLQNVIKEPKTSNLISSLAKSESISTRSMIEIFNDFKSKFVNISSETIREIKGGTKWAQIIAIGTNIVAIILFTVNIIYIHCKDNKNDLLELNKKQYEILNKSYENDIKFNSEIKALLIKIQNKIHTHK